MNCECGHTAGAHTGIAMTGQCVLTTCNCTAFEGRAGILPAPEPNEIQAEIEAVGDICRALEPIGDHRIHAIRAAAAFYGIDLVKRGSE